MKTEPQEEHHWLKRLVGEWTFENECSMGPDQPPFRSTGTESVRSFGGLWVIADGTTTTPEGAWHSIITLGYEPAKKRYVGSFIATMMSWFWVYDGAVDESGNRLVLDAEGPSMSGEGTSKYHDIVEFVTDDHRILRSEMLMPDGKWVQFMEAHYKRKA